MKTTLAFKQSYVTKVTLIAAAISGLVGCSGSSSSEQDILAVADIQPMPVSDSKLVSATQSQLALTIHNGLYLSVTGQGNNGNCVNCEFMSADGAPERTATSDFSSTTTQEQGVDESDRVKYDGNTLFVASNRDESHEFFIQQRQAEQKTTAHVRVLNRNADDSLSELAKIEADKDAGYLSDLYLHQNVLTMIYDVLEPIDQQDSSGIADTSFFFPFNSKMGLNFHNVEQRDTPQLMAAMKIDGYMISSRRIDDKVYIVSRYSPDLPEGITVPEGATEAELQQLYRSILATNLEQMLPKVYQQDGATTPLVNADNCYIPQQHSANYGFTNITTVTTFDLDEPSNFQSSCIVAPLDGFYSSDKNMYLYEKQYNQEQEKYSTVIHKFGYQAQGVKYLATGSVLGHVSWNNSHLRFSEKDNYLRVVTSEQDFSSAETVRNHRLFVLQENAQQELQTIAQLPNDANPEKIGKPDEDIYAVRYFGDKAYIVTFRRTDPLYVIDLSKPNAPVIEGELEIPGYSGYLQPINENFVLGIGQQIDPDAQIGLEIVNEPNSEFVQGAKAELYDVSNPAEPKVAATLIYPDVYSVAEWDYRALTQLKVSDNKYKFAFPLGGWSQSSGEEGVVEWSYQQSMQLIELDIAGQGTLNNVGSLSPKSDYFGQWGDRAVLHNDLVFYIRNNEVWQSYWSQPNLLNGPY